MKKFLEEFKTFATKGNVIDMAIGVIMGSAFTAIVTSLVSDIFTPLLTVFTSGIKFKEWTITFGGSTIMIGNFVNAIISFILIALVVFLFVKAINKFKRQEETKKVETKPSNEELLLMEIRDLLKERH